MNNTVVAIMAGGKSRRFGGPKALAEYNGKALITYTFELVSKLKLQTLVVTNPGLHLPVHKYKLIYDEIPALGPIGGLYSVLKKASAEQVLVLPCDMPLLKYEVLKVLLSYSDTAKPVIARSHIGIEPLVSIWPISSLGVLESCITEKKYSLHTPMNLLNSLFVDMTKELHPYKPEYFMNINHQEDLEQLARLKYTG